MTRTNWRTVLTWDDPHIKVVFFQQWSIFQAGLLDPRRFKASKRARGKKLVINTKSYPDATYEIFMKASKGTPYKNNNNIIIIWCNNRKERSLNFIFGPYFLRRLKILGQKCFFISNTYMCLWNVSFWLWFFIFFLGYEMEHIRCIWLLDLEKVIRYMKDFLDLLLWQFNLRIVYSFLLIKIYILGIKLSKQRKI